MDTHTSFGHLLASHPRRPFLSQGFPTELTKMALSEVRNRSIDLAIGWMDANRDAFESGALARAAPAAGTTTSAPSAPSATATTPSPTATGPAATTPALPAVVTAPGMAVGITSRWGQSQDERLAHEKAENAKGIERARKERVESEQRMLQLKAQMEAEKREKAALRAGAAAGAASSSSSSSSSSSVAAAAPPATSGGGAVPVDRCANRVIRLMAVVCSLNFYFFYNFFLCTCNNLSVPPYSLLALCPAWSRFACPTARWCARASARTRRWPRLRSSCSSASAMPTSGCLCRSRATSEGGCLAGVCVWIVWAYIYLYIYFFIFL